MEESTVSPSPASPTAGEDLCETDVTNVAMHSVTLLICLCGLAGNGAVIRILRLTIDNYGIFHLAVADFLFLLLAVPSALLFLVEDVSCSPFLPLLYLRFLLQLSEVSYYWGLFRLRTFRFGKDMKLLYKLGCHCHIPERLWWVLWGTQFWTFFALFTVIPAVTILCPSHNQDQCQALLISLYAIILLLFAAPMLISQTILLIKAKWGSQQQQPKRRDIVIFFIVLFTTFLSLWNLLQQLGYINVSSQVFFLLTCIHSSIKPFIYFLVGGWRGPWSMETVQLSLQRVFEEPEESPARIEDVSRDTVL